MSDKMDDDAKNMYYSALEVQKSPSVCQTVAAPFGY